MSSVVFVFSSLFQNVNVCLKRFVAAYTLFSRHNVLEKDEPQTHSWNLPMREKLPYILLLAKSYVVQSAKGFSLFSVLAL